MTFAAKRFRSGERVHGGYAGTRTTHCQPNSARVFDLTRTDNKPVKISRKLLCEKCFSPTAKPEWFAQHGIELTD